MHVLVEGVALRGKEKHLFPIFLDLHGLRVLVVGGGPVALRKATTLQQYGATVQVVAMEFAPGWSVLKKVRRSKRSFKWSDLRGARLVFAATSDAGLNERITKRAKKNGAWVNCATQTSASEAGDFQTPAQFQEGRLQIVVSTSGASAAAARTIKEELEQRLTPDAKIWTRWLNLLDARRAKIMKRVTDPEVRRALFQKLGSPECLETVGHRGPLAAAKQMDAWIERTVASSGSMGSPTAARGKQALKKALKKVGKKTK